MHGIVTYGFPNFLYSGLRSGTESLNLTAMFDIRSRSHTSRQRAERGCAPSSGAYTACNRADEANRVRVDRWNRPTLAVVLCRASVHPSVRRVPIYASLEVTPRNGGRLFEGCFMAMVWPFTDVSSENKMEKAILTALR